MTFTIRHNGKQVARRIEKAIGAASQTAQTDRGLRGMMSAGVARHFRVGRMGGVMTAVVGRGSFSSVHWSQSRHPTTLNRNRKFALLDGPKHILRSGFVTGAFFGQSSSPGGSRASYGPRNSFAINLGRVQQFGGKPLPSPNNSHRGYEAGFLIPPRPFAFWDKQMAEQTIRRIARNFEEAAR